MYNFQYCDPMVIKVERTKTRPMLNIFGSCQKSFNFSRKMRDDWDLSELFEKRRWKYSVVASVFKWIVALLEITFQGKQ